MQRCIGARDANSAVLRARAGARASRGCHKFPNWTFGREHGHVDRTSLKIACTSLHVYGLLPQFQPRVWRCQTSICMQLDSMRICADITPIFPISVGRYVGSPLVASTHTETHVGRAHRPQRIVPIGLRDAHPHMRACVRTLRVFPADETSRSSTYRDSSSARFYHAAVSVIFITECIYVLQSRYTDCIFRLELFTCCLCVKFTFLL